VNRRCGWDRIETAGDGRGSLLLKSLPAFIYVPEPEALNYGWLDDAMKFIADEASADQAGAATIVNRLSEIILLQTIRRYANVHEPECGLFAALADEQLARHASVPPQAGRGLDCRNSGKGCGHVSYAFLTANE
jgi:hypothetical protein